MEGSDAPTAYLAVAVITAPDLCPVKSEPSSDTPLSGKKRKVMGNAAKQGPPSRPEPSTPLGHAHASSSGASPSPPGFSAHKSSKNNCERDPMPRNMAQKPDGGGTSDWEAARQMLQSIVTPALEQRLSAAKPSNIIASSYITALQAANYASFSLGYALELEEKLAAREREAGALRQELSQAEEKLAAREREADALRQELSQAKADIAGKKKAATEEVRSAREAAVREYRGSTEQVLRFAEHALAGYEKGMDAIVPADGGGAQ